MLKIHDRLRRKTVALTPEEWVRQNFVSHLIDNLGYPAGLMGNEVSLKLNDTSRRSDTVVFDRHGNPLVIIEYKAPTVAITQKVFDQAVRYNMVFHAPYIFVSNGINHFCCKIDFNNRSVAFLKEIPRYDRLMQ